MPLVENFLDLTLRDISCLESLETSHENIILFRLLMEDHWMDF